MKEPKYPNKRKPFFTGLKAVLKCIRPKLTLLDRNEGQAEPGIFISNHCGTAGPFMVECYLPYSHHPWGAYQMNGDIKSRFNYLYRVLYMQKLHMKKVPSFLLASIVCVVSKAYYKGMGLISSYPDIRLVRTIKQSIACLEKNTSIVIYPENSNEGYHDQLNEIFGGFCLLSKAYYTKHHVDLPIYPIYYNKFTSRMVVDKPLYLQPLMQKGMTTGEICEFYRDHINGLKHATE
ncbi:MAG: hypothetical protein J6R42_05230 [Clostridia bacterium]|nr:hypothetical protein [Clostridia bacterium]